MAIGGATGLSFVDCAGGIVLDRSQSCLAMAGHALKRIESELVL